MTPAQIDTAARALVAARSGQPIAALPDTARPQSADEAYAIQDAVLARLGERVGGWKVGMLPNGSNFIAPIYASRVVSSPASLPARGFHVIGIECEIGFRINQQLSPRATVSVEQPYTRDEVLAVVSMHPTIEIVDSRYVDFQALDRLQVLADNFSNGALVYGPEATQWQGTDLKRPRIAVTANGKDFADCAGLRAGDPVDLLVTAVNLIERRHGSVPEVGTFVTTGTHTGMVFTEPGAAIRADYGNFGRVEVSFPR